MRGRIDSAEGRLAISTGMIILGVLGLLGLGIVIVAVVLVVWAIANDRRH
jgi:hypothetical protein